MACAERDGLGRTTVADIASTAGVSPRTFFRYFAGKEDAIIPGQRRLRLALEAWAPTRAPRTEVVVSLLRVMDGALRGEGENASENRRIGALMLAEPSLRAHAVAEDALLVRTVANGLGERALDPDGELDQLLAELALVLWRTAWTSWERDPTGAATPTRHWRRLRGRLREAGALLADGGA